MVHHVVEKRLLWRRFTVVDATNLKAEGRKPLLELARRYHYLVSAIVFALVQVFTALRIYGKIKIPRHMPKWWGDVHRLSGTLAFLFTLPVAFHCLWSLGFRSDTGDPRTYVHSIVGCLFYGVFVVKVLSVRIHELPKWLLPVAGSATFAALAVLWSTSAVWYWQNVSFPGV